MNFLLTYAYVPFLIDRARVIRMHHAGYSSVEDPSNLPPKDQQPLIDIIAELNRIYPFRYLQDFGLAAKPGRNLAAVAYLSQMGPEPDPELKVNDWYYPTSASRWSVFRGIATSTQMKAMLAATQGQPATFRMMAAPDSPNPEESYSLATQMYMLPPRPLSEHGNQFDGLYLITLVDERYYFQFSSVSLHVTGSTQWTDLLNQLQTALNITLTYSPIQAPYLSPEPDSSLWSNFESAALLLDAVAYNLGRVVVRNLDGTYNLYTPSESQAIVANNRGQAETVTRVAGGDIFNSGTQKLAGGDLRVARNSVLPANLQVTFPKYVFGDDPVPHFLNPRYPNQRPSAWLEDSYGDAYSINVPLASGGGIVSGLAGVQGISHTIHSTAKALYSGEINSSGVPLNASGLTSLAMQVAGDYFGSQVATALDESYPGTIPWQPDGVHDIIWSYSATDRYGRTRVLKKQWNQTVQEMQHTTPPVTISASGSASGLLPLMTGTPRGVGGPSVALTVRDFTLSGQTVETTLANPMGSGDQTAYFTSVDLLPTQNRWRGQIDREVILFEGTSGGIGGFLSGGLSGNVVSVVYRGVDGTYQEAHQNSTSVFWLRPDTSYGTNLVSTEKMQFLFPNEWTSGGIQGANLVPQTQSVLVWSNSGILLNNVLSYSGNVVVPDFASSGGVSGGISPPSSGIALSGGTSGGTGNFWQLLETVWIQERNNQPVTSGNIYDGQLLGFSPTVAQSGVQTASAPVYAVNVGDSFGEEGKHPLLSPTHFDTVPAEPECGDLIVGAKQAGTAQFSTTGRASQSNTVTASFLSRPIPGDTLLVYASAKWTTPLAVPLQVTDNQNPSNLYVLDQQIVSADGTLYGGIYRCSNVSVNPAVAKFTITATDPGGNTPNMFLEVTECVQLEPTIAASDARQGKNSQPFFDMQTTSIVYEAVMMVASDASLQIVAPEEFNILATEADGLDYVVSQVLDGLFTASGTQTWTTTPASENWLTAAVAYDINAEQAVEVLWERFPEGPEPGLFLRTRPGIRTCIEWETNLQITDGSGPIQITTQLVFNSQTKKLDTVNIPLNQIIISAYNQIIGPTLINNFDMVVINGELRVIGDVKWESTPFPILLPRPPSDIISWPIPFQWPMPLPGVPRQPQDPINFERIIPNIPRLWQLLIPIYPNDYQFNSIGIPLQPNLVIVAPPTSRLVIVDDPNEIGGFGGDFAIVRLLPVRRGQMLQLVNNTNRRITLIDGRGIPATPTTPSQPDLDMAVPGNSTYNQPSSSYPATGLFFVPQNLDQSNYDTTPSPTTTPATPPAPAPQGCSYKITSTLNWPNAGPVNSTTCPQVSEILLNVQIAGNCSVLNGQYVLLGQSGEGGIVGSGVWTGTLGSNTATITLNSDWTWNLTLRGVVPLQILSTVQGVVGQCCSQLTFVLTCPSDMTVGQAIAEPVCGNTASQYPDLDNYMSVDGQVCYYAQLSVGGLSLNHDAYPDCASSPAPPEIITGTFTGTHTFKAWYNQFSKCTVETPPTTASVVVTNTGATNITVTVTNAQGTAMETVPPGGSAQIGPTGNPANPAAGQLTYAGYGTGTVNNFQNGTVIDVTCTTPQNPQNFRNYVLHPGQKLTLESPNGNNWIPAASLSGGASPSVQCSGVIATYLSDMDLQCNGGVLYLSRYYSQLYYDTNGCVKSRPMPVGTPKAAGCCDCDGPPCGWYCVQCYLNGQAQGGPTCIQSVNVNGVCQLQTPCGAGAGISYIIVSGPYPDQTTCTNICSPQPCCQPRTRPMPQQLHLAIRFNSPNALTCGLPANVILNAINGPPYTVWQGTANGFTFTYNCTAQTIIVPPNLVVVGGLSITFNGQPVQFGPVTLSSSCDPYQVIYSVAYLGIGCSGAGPVGCTCLAGQCCFPQQGGIVIDQQAGCPPFSPFPPPQPPFPPCSNGLTITIME